MSNEDLAVAVQNGDRDALARLWEQVKGYAYMVVMRYKEKPYAETEDYLQTAFLGVREAALAFDPSRGSFLTVADWYIRNSCRMFYHWYKHSEVPTVSYDVPYNPEDPADGDYKDVFPDDTLPDPWEDVENEDKKRDVRAAIDDLTPRYQEVIERHYYQGQPLAAISSEQGVSAGRIQQIEARALQQLRRSKYLAPYRREYAPVTSISLRAFQRHGCSIVERVAIKNVDAERRKQRREYMDYVQLVMRDVQNGLYPLETGWNMVERYKVLHGMAWLGEKAASERVKD